MSGTDDRQIRGAVKQAETEAEGSTSPDPLPPRARQQPRWPALVGMGALTLALMAIAAWAGYRGLFALAGGPAVAVKPEYDPDPTGYASIYDLKVTPDGDGVVITWSAQNLGDRNWYPSSHHWKPLVADLPPIPMIAEIFPGQTAHMAVRLTGNPPPRVAWQLVGLGGPVKDGKVEVQITSGGERK